MKKINLFHTCYWLLACLLITGCDQDGPDYVDELDVVYTNYDDSFNFDEQLTYAVPDSIIEVDDIDFDDELISPDFIDPIYADVILDNIVANMDNRGWQQVDKDADPDVIILAAAMQTTNLYYYYDWGYWGWWYPGFYPDWGWWYPGYYPPVVSAYRSGTLVLQMTYPAGIGVNDNIPVVWTSAINGLLEGSTSSINDRLKNTVDQAFIQSPYLSK
ncbi:DUF4136 domain-containing protein [Galbibacter sp. PAP.153]|uniref:DUF4136 domain-containing protein n=1 Tax=Galbibacter sp. PAP.153 TaxID=3104623 RepID=UPI00300BDE2C